MMTDYKDLIQEAIKNLSQRSEYRNDGEVYSIHDLYPFSSWHRRTAEMSSGDWQFREGELVFAEDGCGNYFTLQSDGSVCFLDHETDDRTCIANTLNTFIEGLTVPEKITLPPHKVLRVWKDPNFKPKFR